MHKFVSNAKIQNADPNVAPETSDRRNTDRSARGRCVGRRVRPPDRPQRTGGGVGPFLRRGTPHPPGPERGQPAALSEAAPPLSPELLRTALARRPSGGWSGTGGPLGGARSSNRWCHSPALNGRGICGSSPSSRCVQPQH